jgi:ABC-type multidrug transport system ATPase subunit
MNAIMTCTGLTKIYQNGVTALDNLTLTIDEGMSFGLMGENGANCCCTSMDRNISFPLSH